MNKIFVIALFQLFLIACTNANLSNYSMQDARLESFINQQIADQATAQQMQEDLKNASLEAFIWVAYTNEVAMDTTTDNSNMLAKIGLYLEQSRPELSPNLLIKLRKYLSQYKGNRMMRSMLIQTIEEL